MVIEQITDFVIFGNSTDTKPLAGIPTNTLFFEIDSGNVYKLTGGVWSPFSGATKPETLTNKTLTTPVISQIKNGSGTLTLPTNTTDTVVCRNTTDTMANKTLTYPTIATINNGGVITLPSGARTLVARDTNDTLLNKTINVNSNTLSATSQATGDILINNGTQFIRLARGTNGQVLTSTTTTVNWQAASGGGASTSSANTWSAAQTYNDNMFLLRNPANTFSATIAAGAQTAARTFTFPVTTSDTIETIAATQTITNKTYNIDSNTFKHSTTNTAGDIISNNGTQFVRLARGTANQTLAVNAGGTDIAWTSLNSERTGTATASGNGSTTTFNVAHGLGSTPYMAFIQCSSHSIAFTFTYTSTNIVVVFASAPGSGTNNVIFQWRVVA